MQRIFAGAGVLVLSLAGCRPTMLPEEAPDLTSFLNSDTVAVAGIQLDDLRNTALAQKLKTEHQLPQIEDFGVWTGFDLKDAREVLVGTDGKNAVVVARGRFHANPVNSTTVTEYKGFKLFGKPDGSFAVIDRQTVLAGPQSAIQNAIDTFQNHRRTAPEVLKLTQSLPAVKQVWAVARSWREGLVDRVPKTGNAAMLARTFATLQNTTLSADFRQGVDAVITGEARNATEAKNLGDTLRGMTSLARLNLPKDHPEFGTIFDGIESREDQRGVRITVKVSQELLGGILDWLNAHARR